MEQIVKGLKSFAVEHMQFLVKRIPFDYKKYAKYKFKKYGLTPKFVDIKNDVSKWEENYKTLDRVIKKLELSAKQSVLDIGPGVGLYTEYFLKRGFRNYTAVDFVKEIIEGLTEKFGKHGCRFIQKDIIEEKIGGKYDLIFMIDVTQHIIMDRDFEFIMRNVQNSLNKDGIFLVTDQLNNNKREAIRIRRRPLSYYRKILDLSYVGRADFDTLINNGKQLFIFKRQNSQPR